MYPHPSPSDSCAPRAAQRIFRLEDFAASARCVTHAASAHRSTAVASARARTWLLTGFVFKCCDSLSSVSTVPGANFTLKCFSFWARVHAKAGMYLHLKASVIPLSRSGVRMRAFDCSCMPCLYDWHGDQLTFAIGAAGSFRMLQVRPLLSFPFAPSCSFKVFEYLCDCAVNEAALFVEVAREPYQETLHGNDPQL